MSWQDLGGLGEFVASIGVLVSLVFVIFELRRNTNASRLATIEAANRSAIDVYDAPARDAGLARIVRLGGDDLAALSADERARLDFWVLTSLRAMESLFVQHQAGALDAQTWEGRRWIIRAFVSRPGIREIWSLYRRTFRRDFQECVAALIGEPRGEAEASAQHAESARRTDAEGDGR